MKIGTIYHLERPWDFGSRVFRCCEAVVDQRFQAADEVISDFLARYPDSPWVARAPWQLGGIVEASAKLIPEHVLAKINGVRLPALQANLLIDLAHGVDHAEYQAKAEGTHEASQSKK